MMLSFLVIKLFPSYFNLKLRSLFLAVQQWLHKLVLYNASVHRWDGNRWHHGLKQLKQTLIGTVLSYCLASVLRLIIFASFRIVDYFLDEFGLLPSYVEA